MVNLCIKTPSSAILVLIFQLLVLRPRPTPHPHHHQLNQFFSADRVGLRHREPSQPAGQDLPCAHCGADIVIIIMNTIFIFFFIAIFSIIYFSLVSEPLLSASPLPLLLSKLSMNDFDFDLLFLVQKTDLENMHPVHLHAFLAANTSKDIRQCNLYYKLPALRLK